MFHRELFIQLTVKYTIKFNFWWWLLRKNVCNYSYTEIDKCVKSAILYLRLDSQMNTMHVVVSLCIFYQLKTYYFMLLGSLSENNDGLSLNNFTVSGSEIIIHHADRQFSDISGRSIVFYSSVRLAKYLTENAESYVRKLRR